MSGGDLITMLTLAASPEGVLEPNRTYRVPEDVALPRALELLEGGYAVLAGGTLTQAPPPASGDGPPQDDPGAAGTEERPPALGRMTVEQLRAYAAENDIDLDAATRKGDILAAIEAAETGGGG
ncbi:Rho termination factor N-terminal domain-containing protein [Kitasatospora purpeofusca]|uniref:Rho termination factor N-terminal domain-containing protein n=1 Tax=Kitasatospora purpeofusca TaxID=67352 RepID=UPI00367B060D